jgi:hypothetical protein
MVEIFNAIIFIGFALALFSFAIGVYMNVWIYYCEEDHKFPLFPFLNPFSFSSYELLLNSMFKFDSWEVNGENQKLKRKSNNLRKFSRKILLITIGVIILNWIIN